MNQTLWYECGRAAACVASHQTEKIITGNGDGARSEPGLAPAFPTTPPPHAWAKRRVRDRHSDYCFHAVRPAPCRPGNDSRHGIICFREIFSEVRRRHQRVPTWQPEMVLRKRRLSQASTTTLSHRPHGLLLNQGHVSDISSGDRADVYSMVGSPRNFISLPLSTPYNTWDGLRGTKNRTDVVTKNVRGAKRRPLLGLFAGRACLALAPNGAPDTVLPSPISPCTRRCHRRRWPPLPGAYFGLGFVAGKAKSSSDREWSFW